MQRFESSSPPHFVPSSSEIPQYRLPYDVVSFEVELMKDLGVQASSVSPPSVTWLSHDYHMIYYRLNLGVAWAVVARRGSLYRGCLMPSTRPYSWASVSQTRS